MNKIVLAIVVITSAFAAKAQLPSHAEYNALIDFYISTNGAEWDNNDGWATANPAVVENVSSWYGVLTDGNGHVTMLDLDGNLDYSYYTNSSGYQEYPGNHLTGTLPSSIGNLSWLVRFNVGGNEISGSIPGEIGQLTNLQWFIAAYNQLSGSIPASIGNLTNLDRIMVEYNQLSGSIPNSIGNLVNMWGLQFNNNQLTGPIPASFGNLTQLVYFSLDNNSLVGPIPPEIGNMESLTSIGFNNNSLTGEIPEELGNLSNAIFLHLNLNQLTGTIPSSLANLTHLSSLNLSNNNLSGHIPTGLANIDSLNYINLLGNKYLFADILPFKNAYSGTLLVNSQQHVDVEKTHLSHIGDAITLSATVERNTDPAVNYQWFKIENASEFPHIELPLNAESPSSYSFTISPVSQSTDSIIFFYKITHSMIPGMTLISSHQHISIVPSSINYIRTITPTVSGLNTLVDIENSSSTDFHSGAPPQSITAYTYLDGLGRPVQNVTKHGAPSGSDVVQPVVYDQFGRETIKYLPFTSGSDGNYKEPDQFINSAGQYIGDANFYSSTLDDERPFSETVFEASPLNRPSKQYGPGEAWAPVVGNNKFIEHRYLVNIHGTSISTVEEAVIVWRIINGNVAPNGHYSSNQLSIKVTIDENGNSVRDYINKQGQVILKKVQAIASPNNLNDPAQWACTYYIYDDKDNLSFVLQPEGVKQYLNIGQP